MKIATPEAMEALGQDIANISDRGDIIYLKGELGTGKTTLVRGFLRGFGIKEHVKSPTFNLFELYEVQDQAVICHVDLYRLKRPEELLYVGLRDYVNEKNIWLIEWPEKGKGFLPEADLVCNLDFVDNPDMRMVNLIALSSRGEDIIKKIDLSKK